MIQEDMKTELPEHLIMLLHVNGDSMVELVLIEIMKWGLCMMKTRKKNTKGPMKYLTP